MSSFIFQNLTEIEAVTGCTFACLCHTVFLMFSCVQINWQPFLSPPGFEIPSISLADQNLS